MNRLRYETSPYLLQHADNPVDWYPWGEEALGRAKAEGKPILLSIGYATCHWCHVMERESFRDPDVAAFMNRHFINVKIDREERPDLDQLYMEAGYLLNRTSGWPLHCFLTPEGKPFFAGSYFPPEPGARQMAWFQALQFALHNFRENRAALEQQADRITRTLQEHNREAPPQALSFFENPFDPALADRAFEQLKKRFDPQNGGFGEAPKFPDLLNLRFLLHYHHYSQSQEALDHLLLTLDRMVRGGIYDAVGGGIARYAVDRAWRTPHFEKMLYDNALFAQLLAHVYSLTRDERWKRHLDKTLQFLRHELSGGDGGFFSGLDAESEGVEGKYYTWTLEELKAALPHHLYGEAIRLFAIEENGANILHQPFPEEEKTLEILDHLAKARERRSKPKRDTKLLLGWNALTVSAFARGYEATGNAIYQREAISLAAFLLRTFRQPGGQSLLRVAAQGQVYQPALLQDYAFLAQALLDVYRITWDTAWLDQSLHWAEVMLSLFEDPEGQLLFFNHDDLIVRTKETHDLELPSSNGAAIQVFHQLGLLLSRHDLRERASNMLLVLKKDLEHNPASHGASLCQWLREAYGTNEVVLVGPKALEWAGQMRSRFIPNAVFLPTETESDRLPLWEGRPAGDQALIYVCQEQACLRPVGTVEDGFALLLKNVDR
jgi:uncharacterized protein YyaL (SSP411 family)